MDKPKVSVIVPVYNTAQYLSRCLDSIVNQSLSEIEILVFDDCSTDGSVNIIHDFLKKSNNIIFIQNDKNVGLGAIRNLGVQRANGKYIMFVDSDDWIDINACETLYQIAEKNKLEIIVGKYQENYGEKPQKVEYNLNTEIEINNGETFIKQYEITSYVWDKFWLKEHLIAHNLKNEEGRYYEDVSFTLVGLLLARRVASIKYQFIYYYIPNLTSISRMAPTNKHLRDRLWVMSYFIEKIDFYDDKEIVVVIQRMLAIHIRAGLSSLRRYNGSDKVLRKKLLNHIVLALSKSETAILKVKQIPFLKRLLIFISPHIYLNIYSSFDRLKVFIKSVK